MRGEWERSAGESDQSQSWTMEEKIRRLTRRIEGLERRKRREDEKTSKGSFCSEDGPCWRGPGAHRVYDPVYVAAQPCESPRCGIRGLVRAVGYSWPLIGMGGTCGGECGVEREVGGLR